VVGACGNGQIDRQDELGAAQEGAEERYELVIVQAEPEEGGDTLSPPPRPAEVPPVDEPVAAIVFDPQGEFTVQVGAYDAPRAEQLVHQLKAEGYPAYALANPDRQGKRVRIGYFRTREDALRFGALFKEDRRLDFWVDRRANEP
jgi:cell division septation protein DedD